MSHSCSSALIRCMDFRLTKDIHKWMEEKGIINDCDVISIAGISKAIADNPDSEESKFILNQIGLSIKLHSTKTLYIMHHTDCGAYGGHQAFVSLDEEIAKYKSDMERSGNLIKRYFPNLEIKYVIADIKMDWNASVKEI